MTPYRGPVPRVTGDTFSYCLTTFPLPGFGYAIVLSALHFTCMLGIDCVGGDRVLSLLVSLLCARMFPSMRLSTSDSAALLEFSMMTLRCYMRSSCASSAFWSKSGGFWPFSILMANEPLLLTKSLKLTPLFCMSVLAFFLSWNVSFMKSY